MFPLQAIKYTFTVNKGVVILHKSISSSALQPCSNPGFSQDFLHDSLTLATIYRLLIPSLLKSSPTPSIPS